MSDPDRSFQKLPQIQIIPLSDPHPHGTFRALFQESKAMSYAIFKTGGKQYRAGTGEILSVEKLEGEAGATITFEDVLLVGEGAQITVGKDLKGGRVTAQIVEQFKGPKLIAYKYRRRKGYHRTVGHRQQLTKVKVTEISS